MSDGKDVGLIKVNSSLAHYEEVYFGHMLIMGNKIYRRDKQPTIYDIKNVDFY